MEQNSGGSPSNWAGALCEVMTMENGLRFAGTVGAYDAAAGESSVELRKGESTPGASSAAQRSRCASTPSGDRAAWC